MNAGEFVASLYDAILTAGRRGEVPVRFADADDDILPTRWPSKPWQWMVLGDTVFWFLQIRDDREPTQGRVYQLDAAHNFWPWALELGMATPDRISDFLQMLITAMDAQELGQREAAANPEWKQRGEFLNPWANRLEFNVQLSATQQEITETQFLGSLYDSLASRRQEDRVPWNTKAKAWLPSPDKLHPSKPRFQDDWHWELKGSREHWWLEIVDPRYPGPEYPYRLIPTDDPAFFQSAQSNNLVDTPDTFIELLITMMDEQDLGQSQAEAAYNQGANADAPPWVHTE